MGYSYYHTPRITILETGVGSLKKGEEVRVSVLTEKPEDLSYFKTVYQDAYIEVINSNLKISNIKVMSGSNDIQPFLSFTIESESTDIPATLKLSMLTFKLNRPEKYNVNAYVHIWGDAVAKHYNPYESNFKNQNNDLRTLFVSVNLRRSLNIPVVITVEEKDNIFKDNPFVTSEITIRETLDGAIERDFSISMFNKNYDDFRYPYEKTIDIIDAKVEIIKGNIVLSPVKVKNNSLFFTVLKKSTIPSTIKISDVVISAQTLKPMQCEVYFGSLENKKFADMKFKTKDYFTFIPVEFTEEKYKNLDKSILLHIDNSMVLKSFKYHYIGNGVEPINDKNETTAVPITLNGRTFVPLDYYYYWHSKYEKRTWLNEKEKQLLDEHVKTINGELYVPLRTIEEARGNYVFYDFGLIVISKTEVLNSVEDRIYIEALKKDFKKWVK